MIGPAVQAISANPQGAGAIAAILGIPYRNGPELVGAIVQGLVFQAVELADLLQRTGGQSFFDNTATVYGGPLPPEVLAGVNAGVARFTSPPEVKRFLARSYEPTGRLRIPMITIHSRFDPSVPLFHESAYADRVSAQGNADLLEQRFTDEPAHVTYPAEVTVAAFEDLVRRVQSCGRGRGDHDREVIADDELVSAAH